MVAFNDKYRRKFQRVMNSSRLLKLGEYVSPTMIVGDRFIINVQITATQGYLGSLGVESDHDIILQIDLDIPVDTPRSECLLIVRDTLMQLRQSIKEHIDILRAVQD